MWSALSVIRSSGKLRQRVSLLCQMRLCHLTRVSRLLKRFKTSEHAAVTVDWVVVTAAVVGIGFVVLSVMRPSIASLAESISTQIDLAGEVMSKAGALDE